MKKQDAVKIGINGLGRIGKLTLWHHVGRKYFQEIVVNIGRSAGSSMNDIAHYIERDSTYGHLHSYLHGCSSTPVIEEVDEVAGTMVIDGVNVRFLRKERNPADIGWRNFGVKLVVDTTGSFLDPTVPADAPKGALRGHLVSGAEKVVLSAPFKIKDKQAAMPDDAVTTVMGINENDYDPRRHVLVSNASCTTTCLAHMIKPLLNHFGPRKILSASMATIHAATASQEVLDRLPKAGKTDLRKNRSVLNNIILTTTGAANALRLVIPEMRQIGFIAESVRVPVTSGSLIILVVNLQEELSGDPIRRERINNIYRQAAAGSPNGYLLYTDKQNVSADIIGAPRAAAVIEGSETHTRTAEVAIDLHNVPGLDDRILSAVENATIRVPVTQTVIFGWYDNEMASYVNILGDRCVSVAEILN
ncbi:type I glyceraldehyde-3-phosphate dehydrogenase [Desulfosudis oleivorans]|uniref:Glyceraldehyde-3-phosphate dehydrogenase (Phosphorylating) n=1 Tax=Desulfosudis oleivorans (strain DSM 6200 / JCM 39069 / Hxd3) TaxID=96561 RepID=A8ZS14_DESOH|nr:glyceraldehyde 3-phosphate dehydrogenase NAD-binding domain-containing protein [Desulfosudis oleivorans]ABW66032.1 Glyceraldehyde-3-phosphate dehydrogenase (phosphorylating) [Desulfosudis oleivorans Hxd3]